METLTYVDRIYYAQCNNNTCITEYVKINGGTDAQVANEIFVT